MVGKLLVFGNLSYIEFSQNLTKLVQYDANKTCQVLFKKLFHINNILQNTQAHILQKNYHVDTGSSIMNRCNKWITY